MNIFSKIFCRIYQTCFYLAMPLLPYREPVIYNSVSELPKLFKEKGLTTVLLVTDKGIRSNGISLPLERLCEESGITLHIYDGTNVNPTVENVEEAAALYNRYGCKAIIALGGGSSIDCAKAAGARIAYPKKSLDKLKGLLKVWRKIPVFIAIPTTAGTGSEVTVTAVITNSTTHHKYTMNNFTFIPDYAVLDPELTYSLPSHLTATTGMDALTHAVEAYIGRSTTKQTRALALEAVKLVFENIETAYSSPSDRRARENMLSAAYKAGVAFSKSYVGYIHAVAHSLGGRYGIPHGLANSVLMPIVLEEYGTSVHKKLYELGKAAGVCDETHSYSEGAERFIRSVRTLNHNMGIPDSLEKIKKEDVPAMAKKAAKEANPLYPVPVLMNAKELEKFYYKVGKIK